MRIAITGATGNMGREVMKQIISLSEAEEFRCLSRSAKNLDKLNKILKKYLKKTGGDISAVNKIERIEGSLSDPKVCEKLIDGVDYVLAIGAVIPPQADQDPKSAIDCNERGTDALVSVIEAKEVQPKLLHVSTMALYGNRNSRHPWGRVGDPLLISPFDVYAATKMRGEFRVMNSGVENWAVIRQSAMLHDNMLSGNISDGLMFHTCFNAPLEWVTAHDSGVLVRRILERDLAGELDETNFWEKCFNIGGGAVNRIIGYDTLNDGFKMIGGTAKNFFKPYYNATRNFHGLWFTDGDELDKLFGYVEQDTTAYWKHIAKLHPAYGMGKIVPKSLIASFVIKPLLKNYNAPSYWAAHGDEARLTAYFGGRDKYEDLPEKWDGFPLLSEGRDEWGEPIDYEKLRTTPTEIDHGFDFSKADKDIDISDLKSVAEAHGGKLLSEEFAKGDMHARVKWLTQDGEEFEATPYSVLRAGHWFNVSYREYAWDFDRLAKKDRLYAQIWYDSHERDEDVFYGLDENFNAFMRESK
ncbi:NAD-dependent epimerase/dehydratase family protein [Anaerocaecibacter muris]|uniref:NAD-dependent epimerase/dehydratase family protein n=1 Tax=Anaerocaecibacter muris TaxID=2941513 RepID=UPI003F68FD51